MKFSDPIGQIKGIGKSRETLLQQAGIYTVADLLSYIPTSYEDSSDILTIDKAKEKMRSLPVWELGKTKFAVKAFLRKATSFSPRRGLFITTASFSDEQNEQSVKVVWFNQSYITSQLIEGSEYVLFGKVQIAGNTYTLQSPKFERIEQDKELEKLGRIMPVYRRVKTVTSTYLRKYIQEALSQVSIDEFISPNQLMSYSLPALPAAYRLIHQPEEIEQATSAYERLAVQEFLEMKEDYDQKFPTIQKPTTASSSLGKQIALHLGKWFEKLPFKLTEGQQKVLQNIVETIESGNELDSLLYGDVGSGKTIIALLLAFAFAKENKSTILVAPTTILATQHVSSVKHFLKLLDLEEQIVIAEVFAKRKANSDPTMPTLYIGTQAILHDKKILEDKRISFVVVDEQHRFGVEQRMMLKKSGRHVLTLSATPIPRTLALSFLKFSSALFLEDRPVGRKETISRVVPFGKEDSTYEWIAKRLHFGEQAYIVFPRIESEEDSEKQSLLAMSVVLKEGYFKNIPSALLHGGMKEEEKGKVMADFSAGKIRLLFSTSVIEVGVDVANATVIAIHGAEWFGLAQLHQLRGRVGRSDQQGYCFLFPSQEDNEDAIKRLTYFADHTSGNDVSEYDLTHRGSGSLTGTLQAGASELKIASLHNLPLIKDAITIYEELSQNKASIQRYIRIKSA